jgi:autotransporter adhesin
MLKKRALLATVLTGASLTALTFPADAWATVDPNVTPECAVSVDSATGPIDDTTQCGVGAATSNEDGTAVGAGAIVSGVGGTAVGSSAKAGRSAIAIGFDAESLNFASTAVGVGAKVLADASVALGASAKVAELDAAGVAVNNAVAIGQGSLANRTNSVSIGNDGTDGALRLRQLVNLAAGTANTDAVNLGQTTALIDTKIDVNNIALDIVIDDKIRLAGVGGAGGKFLAVNPDTNITGTVAAGAAATAANVDSLALGQGADASALNTIAIGSSAAASGRASIAFGFDATAAGANSIAVGAGAKAEGVATMAIGDSARALASVDVGGTAVAVDNAVAIGFGSLANRSNSVSIGNDGSVGTVRLRKLVNLDAGTEDTDATNLGQVKTLIANAGIGGGAGGGVVVPANVFVAVKEVAGAAPAEAAVAGTIALGGGSKATLAGAVAVGEGATASAGNAAAFGAGANVGANALNSVALGSGSVASEANAVSIGSGKTGDAFATRKLVNVTAGTAGTDAVNVAQLNAVKSDLKLATDDIGILKGDVLALKNAANTGGAGGGFLAVKPATGAAAAVADKDGAIALGGNAFAATENAVAIGTGATAKDGAAVSIGLGNTASGNGAVAIGDPNTATGQGAVALGFTNTATGLAAVALGSESQAIGDSAFAQGNKAKAIGFSALALGEGAVAELQIVSNPPSNPAEPNPGANIAIGLGAKAIAQTTIAIGNGAVADAEDATVVGDKSKAAFHATAIGGEVIASGRGSQAFGWQTNALGNTSTALGFRANAVGNGSITVGANTRAEGLNATAIGAGATANFANSTAIGTGAAATRADQIVLGRKAVTANGVTTPGTSVTIADIAASTAAQSGPTDVMTVDAFGTIGRDPSIRASISTLNGQVADLQKGQEELFDLVSFNRKEARRGIAAASALTAAPMPSEPGKTSFVAGTAFYRGEGAFSMSFNHRLNLDIPVAFGGGFAHSGGKDTVVRAHVATEF